MFIQIIHGVKDLILWTVTQPHVGLLLWEFFFSMEWIIVETRVVVGFETLPTSSTLCHVTLWPLSLKRQCVTLLLESGLEWGTDLAGKKIATPHKQKLEWLAWFHSFPCAPPPGHENMPGPACWTESPQAPSQSQPTLRGVRHPCRAGWLTIPDSQAKHWLSLCVTEICGYSSCRNIVVDKR